MSRVAIQERSRPSARSVSKTKTLVGSIQLCCHVEKSAMRTVRRPGAITTVRSRQHTPLISGVPSHFSAPPAGRTVPPALSGCRFGHLTWRGGTPECRRHGGQQGRGSAGTGVKRRPRVVWDELGREWLTTISCSSAAVLRAVSSCASGCNGPRPTPVSSSWNGARSSSIPTKSPTAATVPSTWPRPTGSPHRRARGQTRSGSSTSVSAEARIAGGPARPGCCRATSRCSRATAWGGTGR